MKRGKYLVFLLTFVLLFLVGCFENGSTSSNNSSNSGKSSDSSTSDVYGTYYLYKDEELNKDKYFKISSDKWEDEKGESGTFSISGTTISFYMEMFGSKEELYSGTISSGELVLDVSGVKTSYYKSGFEPGATNEVKYNIAFDNNGHGSKSSNINNVSSIPDSLPILEDDDYSFGGWYIDSNLTVLATSGTRLNENIILYAKWTKITDYNSISLTFETNGGTYIKTQKIIIGNAANKPDNPTKEGYIFDGWYIDSTFTKAFNFNTLLSSNKTIYAKWLEDCLVTFVNYDNTTLKTYHVKYGETVVYDGVTPTHQNSKYIFIGWDKTLTNITTSVTIKAVFEEVLVGTNGFEYRLSSNKSYYIIEGSGDINDEEVIIPYAFNNLPIKEISSGALSGLTNTKKIVIQNNIEKIGNKAITNCDNLEEIVIPFVGESKTTTTNIAFNYIFNSIPSKLHTIRVNGGEIKGTSAKSGGFSQLSGTNVRNIYLSSAVTSGGYYGFGSTLDRIKLYIDC